MERFGIGEPAEQSGRFMFRGAAEIGEQRRSQQRPPEAVDSYPIAVQRTLQPPVGTKIGVRPPCDIGQQTGGVAKDRTSVVAGKRGSVRVHLGVRGRVKKKKT